MAKLKVFQSPHYMMVPSLSCQASCKYCFGPNQGAQADNKTVERMLDYIQYFSDSIGQDDIHITIHGGEPLTAGHEVIRSMLRGIQTRFEKAKVNIQSNLWLLDDAYCRMFRDYRVTIGTSLDGPKAINDRQRGEGYFKKTFEGIQLAREHGLDVGCIATFTSLSAPHWREVAEFFLKHRLAFSIHGSVTSESKPGPYHITPTVYGELLTQMMDWYKNHLPEIRISTLDQYCRSVYSGVGQVCTFLDCFGSFLVIDPNGDIFSCQRFAGQTQYKLGNIGDMPLSEDLEKSLMGQRLAAHRIGIQTVCEGCEHIHYCNGGCAFNAIRGRKAADPFCDGYKAVFSGIKKTLYQEMISEENQQEIAKFGILTNGNPLMRKGSLTSISRDNTHPYDVTRRARRIIACCELAKNQDFNKTLESLAKMGLGRTRATLRRSLSQLRSEIDNINRLNKIYIHVTDRCQLYCDHCYANAKADIKTPDMSAEQAVKLVKQAGKQGFMSAVITGGEPLLTSDFDILLDQLAAIRNTRAIGRLILRSNFAMQISDKRLKKMSFAFDEIAVSIDGDMKTHNNRRGKGTYQKTVDNITRYLAFSLKPDAAKISLAASLTQEQAEGRPGTSVYELAQRLNISKVKITPVLPIGRAIGNDLLQYRRQRQSHPEDLLETSFTPRKTCGIGQNLYIQPRGDAYPCYAWCNEAAYLGNVIKVGLESVVKQPKFEQLKSYNVDTNERCKTCPYRYLCGGMCLALSSGSNPDPHLAYGDCTEKKRQFEILYKAALDYLNLGFVKGNKTVGSKG